MNDQAIVRVRDVMKKEFDLVDGMTTVAEALQSMKHRRTKTLIVDKRDDDDEYGIVVIGDIAWQVLAKGRSPNRVNIYEIMTKPVLTVTPSMQIRYCARLFSQLNLSRAPVVEKERMVGIVSLTDMVLQGIEY